MLATLPERLLHWAIGEAGDQPALPVEHWSGPFAAEYAWRDLFHRRNSTGSVPQEVCGVLPDFTRYLDPTEEGEQSFVEAMGQHRRARAIFADPLPEGADVIMRPYLAVGCEVKTHSRLPSWMWVDSHATVALPNVWGQTSPDAVTLFHSPVLAGAACALFETLWSTGYSLPPAISTAEWEPMLHLLHQGATIETASRMLGLSPRTGRRRVHDAMEFYNVDTMFMLATAWGTDQARHLRYHAPSRGGLDQ